MERIVTDRAQRYFVTGVSMITSVGDLGHNVMAAEWTMQISYNPFLIAVFIHKGSITLKNIQKTKEFGINLASESQPDLVSIAGGYSGYEIDKLKVRNSFAFIKSKHIKSRLIAGCVINAECKLVSIKKFGDHTMVIGKVIKIRYDKTKKPLLYHTNKYYHVGSQIEPLRHNIKIDRKTFHWFSNEADRKFILKCAGAVIKSQNRLMIQIHSKKKITYETIPYLKPKSGTNYLDSLQRHLQKIGIKVKLKPKPILKKIILVNKKRFQRVNFVLFEGTLLKPSSHLFKNKNNDKLLKTLLLNHNII